MVEATLEYRKELDGLRALAVLSVIIYHAKLKFMGLELFSGGFFGVDIFFVLSGYLITSIVKHGFEQREFSFVNFYWRRVKRIVPALLVVLAVTAFGAYKILLPDDLVSFGKSLTAALYFSSNFYFFNEDSYTAAASVFKPLLHTWSLGVEWQYYIIFPVVMCIIYKFFRKYAFTILAAMGFFSLQLADFTVVNHPDFAFYLLPTRAWELIAGGLCAYVGRDFIYKREGNAKLILSILPLLGIFLITYSLLCINDKSHLPSYLSLMPVLGTCLLIIFSQKDEVVSSALSLKPIVFVGAVSYSLYLWHQPVFVFYRFTHQEVLTVSEFLLLTVISFGLAVFTYYFVENPLRKLRSKKYALSIAACVLVIFIGGCSIVNHEGFPQRLGGLASLYDKGPTLPDMSDCGLGIGKRCLIQDKNSTNNIVLIGDSHAQAMALSLSDFARKNDYNLLNFAVSGCPGIALIKRKLNDGVDEICNSLAKKADDFIKKNKNSLVVYMTRMPLYMLNDKNGPWVFSTTGKGITHDIQSVITGWGNNGNKVIVIYPVPQPPFNVPNETNKRLAVAKSISEKLAIFNDKSFLEFDKNKYSKVWDVNFKKARELFDGVNGDNIIRIYPEEQLCNGNVCRTHSDKHLFYKDDNHLTYYGMNLVVGEINQKLNLSH
ncbi:acyltransferase family protein [Mixta theicola]|uniref:acyltransferase family protein n=1 Tax=Mixta theicola TaxID=1458355 RepID=UPI002ADDDFFB|nr:acyltransferase family protein [Mixta theicola]